MILKGSRNIFSLIVGLILILSPKFVLGTHIVGGELTYQCLGNNNYQITLKLYRDCFVGQAPYDNPAYVGIYDNFQNLISTVSLSFPGAQQVPPLIISPCLIPPGNICVEEAIYQGTVNLPPLAGGYHLVYQRCCRNGTITNLNNPGNTGATYSAYIPGPSVVSCNSSPRFNNFPPLFLCANVPFSFDHSATDLDGDSLVYELCTPFSGATPTAPMPNPPSAPPFPLVNFSSPYSGTYPLASNPALSINQNTGYMTATPNTIGQFVVGVCVSEYRNGVLISTTRRDFQFNVLSCQAAIASIPAQTVFCNGYTVDFVGSSINGNQYFWNFGDPTTLADTSNLISTSYTYPDSGTYTVMLVAYDPAGNCYDTAYSTFQVYPLLEPQFTAPDPQCLQGNSFSFQAGGAFTGDASFNWNFGNQSNPQQSTLQNPTGIVFNNTGTFPVTLTVSQYGCSKSFTANIEVVPKPEAIISSVNQYCVGNLIDFGNNSQGGVSYFWDFGITGINNDTSTSFSPSFLYPDSGIYTVTLIAYNGNYCADTTSLNFYVYPLLNASLTGAGDQCLVGNNFNFAATGSYTGDATFSWNFGSTANILNANSQTVNGITFTSAGIFPISLTVSQYGCNQTIVDSAGLFNTPESSFSLGSTLGCVPFRVQFTNNSTADTPPLYFWNLGDNSSSNVAEPLHIYTQPGNYTVTLTIITTSGCIDTSTFVINNAVEVYPAPIANFEVSQTEVSIFEPEIQITDFSSLNIGCSLHISDGTSYSDCTTNHVFQDTGTYYITQRVINEIGCIDSLVIKVVVSPEYRLWIPNAFTPNGDGLNDWFLPSTSGIESFEMIIYNRWGEDIYTSKDMKRGWDGTSKGADCPQGAYVYHLTVTPFKQAKKTFVGSVTLLR
jgi:gliding motility-associated-like protein